MRRFEERSIEQELASINAQCRRLELAIAADKTEIVATWRTGGPPVDIGYRIAQSRYSTFLRRRIDEAGANLEGLQGERVEVLERYGKAMRRRMVLERLKERAVAKFRSEGLRDEERRLEDSYRSGGLWRR